jgi:hypothetical protein
MNLFRLTAALLLTAASALSAQAATYNYTGNDFTFDTINASNSRLLASFTFDIADDFSGSLKDLPWSQQTPLAWSTSAGAHSINSTGPGSFGVFDFRFEKGDVKEWYFHLLGQNGSVQSLSTDYSFFAPNEAHDIAFSSANGIDVASVHAAQGTWTTSPVPEPESYLMLGAGLAVLAAARRKQKQFIAKQ